jgi:hypothetical protein
MAAQRIVFSFVSSHALNLAMNLAMSLSMAIGMVAASHGTADAQENRGTMEQQMACTPDVWRLCGAQIPDVDRIVACLHQNTAQLSAPCRAVFVEPNTSPPPPQRTARARGRANQPRQQYDAESQSRPPYEAAPQPRPRYDDDE